MILRDNVSQERAVLKDPRMYCLHPQDLFDPPALVCRQVKHGVNISLDRGEGSLVHT